MHSLEVGRTELAEDRVNFERSSASIKERNRKAEEQLRSKRTELERNIDETRSAAAVLERERTELQLERSTLDADKRHFEVEMQRLTELGMQVRRQTEEVNEAQRLVLQERMRAEMIRDDYKQFAEKSSQQQGWLDGTALQLQVARRRKADAEMKVALARKQDDADSHLEIGQENAQPTGNLVPQAWVAPKQLQKAPVPSIRSLFSAGTKRGMKRTTNKSLREELLKMDREMQNRRESRTLQI